MSKPETLTVTAPDLEDGAIGAYLVPQDGPTHPRAWYERCSRFEEHQHLADYEPAVGFLLRTRPKIVHERQILGTVHMPTVTGSLREVFEWLIETLFKHPLDYLVVLDAGYWLNADDRAREILMHHEMSHMVQKVDGFGAPRFVRETGLPVWGLRGHDVEEFTSVVNRYGAYSEELRAFINAASTNIKS